jgi:hypothetical protein
MSKETTRDILTVESLTKAVEYLGSDEYAKRYAEEVRAGFAFQISYEMNMLHNAIKGHIERLNKMKKWQIIKRWKTLNSLSYLVFLYLPLLSQTKGGKGE